MAKMKYKGLIIVSVVFFLLIQTSYFWEPWLETWGILLIFLLVIAFMALAGLLLSHLLKLISERFRNRQRLIITTVLLVVVSTALLRPTGIINFDRFAGKDLFIAMREGAMDCQTILKLKDNNTFVERHLCFGISETKGTYAIKGDSILFSNAQPDRRKEKYYMYGVIRKTSIQDQHMVSNIIGSLDLYNERKDTADYSLLITKNDFPK